jgi:RNA polymerase sigma-70 factor (ECF subfamily)
MSEDEFRAAFLQHKDAIYRFAWRMAGSAAVAEDVAQDCFLALVRDPGRFESGRGTLRAFLFGIARNRILERWRAERRWDSLDDDVFAVEPVDPGRRETSEIVAGAVRSLPPLQREVLVLAEYEGLALGEIALAVGSETGTVKSRLHRARENLRRMLAPLRDRIEKVK